MTILKSFFFFSNYETINRNIPASTLNKEWIIKKGTTTKCIHPLMINYIMCWTIFQKRQKISKPVLVRWFCAPRKWLASINQITRVINIASCDIIEFYHTSIEVISSLSSRAIHWWWNHHKAHELAAAQKKKSYQCWNTHKKKTHNNVHISSIYFPSLFFGVAFIRLFYIVLLCSCSMRTNAKQTID